MKFFESPEVWDRRRNRAFIFENSDIRIVDFQDFDRVRLESESLSQPQRPILTGLRKQSWKVHGKGLSSFTNSKSTTPTGLKMRCLALGFKQFEDYEPSSQRGMTAEPYFAKCCKPTEFKAVSDWDQESRREKAIFCSDFA